MYVEQQLSPFQVKLLESLQRFCTAIVTASNGTSKSIPRETAVAAAANMAKDIMSSAMVLGPSMSGDIQVALGQVAIVKGWVRTLSSESVAFAAVKGLLTRLIIVDITMLDALS